MLALLPSPASAATCADYATQADAQRAADTRDPDGDGIYCESLPCPCATPHSARATRTAGAPAAGNTEVVVQPAVDGAASALQLREVPEHQGTY